MTKDDARKPLTITIPPGLVPYLESFREQNEPWHEAIVRALTSAQRAGVVRNYVPRAARGWSDYEDALITDGFRRSDSGVNSYTYPTEELAVMLDRSVGSIITRRSYLRRRAGVFGAPRLRQRAARRTWTSEEDAVVMERLPVGIDGRATAYRYAVTELAAMFGRTEVAINNRRRVLMAEARKRQQQ